MTCEELISLVRRPETLAEKDVPGLKNLVDSFPYFVQARMLYVKALKESKSIHFAFHSKQMALHAPDRRRLYFYLYPGKAGKDREARTGKHQKTSAGEYFDMMDAVERKGGDSRQSLKELAERLKTARELVSNDNREEKGRAAEKEALSFLSPPKQVEITEENAKKRIREKKYEEAVEILKALNLNNPKKSSYFADQIRFLEKIIINTKR
ncbi:MAG: hypothetical protein LBS07_00890 [Prevotellaceae bacterium]|jgi:hypothetical protein|nr:hypothetical protein [Prevotellaceae bacterium]